jgi:hypothetical protein
MSELRTALPQGSGTVRQVPSGFSCERKVYGSEEGGLNKPLAIDLFCGLGGWTDGLLAEGYQVIGFDIEAHDYGDGKRYPAQLVIQDVLTIHGSQFKDAALIVASPPCQEYSYMAMPWSRAKAIAAEYKSGKRDVKKLRALFDACFRIQREAIEAAGHFIPMVVENVRGAQPWVGKARWNFGSYYLWGDVPALMPITIKRTVKGRSNFHFHEQTGLPSPSFHAAEHEASVLRYESIKNSGGSWFNIGSPGQKETNRNPVHELAAAGFKSQGLNWSDRAIKGQDFTRVAGRQAEGIKHGGDCFNDPAWAGKQGGVKTGGNAFFENGSEWMISRGGPKSNARKAASAAIAKIPLPLARWIAKVYKPKFCPSVKPSGVTK